MPQIRMIHGLLMIYSLIGVLYSIRNILATIYCNK